MLSTSLNNFFERGTNSFRRDANYTPHLFGTSNDFSIDYNEVKDIQCGGQFSLTLLKNGQLLLCGTLNGIVSPLPSQVEILYPLKCVSIACGRKHILALMEGGYCLSWGVGYFGQLGHGDDSSWDQPKMVHFLEPAKLGTRVIQVACGGSHSGALTENGKVFMWGLNKNGQCGIGTKMDTLTEPRPIEWSGIGSMRAQAIVLGRNHSAMLTTEGRVFVWGAASFGRLGIQDAPKNQYFPVEIPAFRTIPIHSLCSGDFHMLALAHDCSVYAWGYGNDGQSGQGSLLHLKTPQRIEYFNGLQIISIECGASWCMAVSQSGNLYAWGYGDGGWLGLAVPPRLPLVESDNIGDSPLLDYHQTRSFDSRLNVLVPQRVRCMAQHVVERVRCGGGHTIIFASPRTSATAISRESLGRSRSGVPQSQSQGVQSVESGFDTKSTASSSTPTSSSATSSSSSSSSSSGASSSSLNVPRASAGRASGGRTSGPIPIPISIPSSGSALSPLEGRAAELKSSSPTGLLYAGKKSPTLDVQESKWAAGGRLLGSVGGSFSAISESLATADPEELNAQLISWSRHKKYGELEYALSRGDVDVNVRDSAGNTPLIVACQNGHSSVARLLVRNEADVSAANNKGNTALHFCFAYGFEDLGEHLISAGADDFLVNAEGLTCYEGLTQSDLDKI